MTLLRPKILIGALLLTSVSIARADSATYNLGPYTFPDLLNPSFTDTLTGTLTVSTPDSLPHTYSFGDAALSNVIMSGTLNMSSSGGVLPVTITEGGAALNADLVGDLDVNFLQSGSITVSPTGLFLSHDGYLDFDYETNVDSQYVSGHIDPHDDNGTMFFFARPPNDVAGAATMEFFPQNLDLQSAPMFGPEGWEIATAVPEPSTLALLTLGALGLLARRRFVFLC